MGLFFGHGTWVFGAVLAGTRTEDTAPSDAIYVVKVYWPEIGVQVEGDILREIKANFKSHEAAKYFLDVKEECYCQLKDAEGIAFPDSTSSIICNQLISMSFYPGPIEINTV